MVDTGPLSKDSIIRTLTEALRPFPYVHAFWEAGAAAFNRIDTWSDIDLYIVVDDAAVPQTFRVVEESLEGLSPIRLTPEVSWPPPSGLRLQFYHLQGPSECLLVAARGSPPPLAR